MYQKAAALFLILATGGVMAEDFRTGPLIKGYGPVIPVADKDIPVDTERQYRLVFDVSAGAADSAVLNRELETVARFLNMHALNGVPVENMELAVVVHGTAVMSLLSHDGYRERFGRENPSLDLLEQLAASGVGVYVCGQSMGFRDVSRGELSESVLVGLSAMTLLATHQDDGFALMP